MAEEVINRKTAKADNAKTRDHLPARTIMSSFTFEGLKANRTFSLKKTKV